MRRAWDWAAAAAIVLLFLAVASRGLDAPGLFLDEAVESGYGMRLVLGLPPGPTDWAATAAGRVLPLRVAHPYDFCAFSIYWSALAFKLGGVSAATVRWASLSLVACALLLFFGFSREWFPPPVALAACALAAAHSALLVAGRSGFYFNELFVLPPELAALWLVSVWHRTRKPWALCAGCFLWGFGLNVSIKAMAFIVAAPAAYLLFVPRRDWPRPGLAAAAAASAALGAANLLAYCLLRGKLLTSWLASLASPTRAGVDNWALASNAATRAGHLARMLAGEAPSVFTGPLGVTDPLLPAAFAASWLALAALALTRRGREPRAAAGLAGLTALLLLSTCLTPRSLSPQHTLILWPLPMLVVAAALARLRGAFPARRRAVGTALAAGLFCALLASEARVDAASFARLRQTGGFELWSDAIGPLARYLDEAGARKPVAVVWGVSDNLVLLTQGRVDPLEPETYGRGADPALREGFAALLAEPGRRFILSADGVDPLRERPFVTAFFDAAKRARRRPRLEKAFYDRAGRPVYGVWTAAR